MRQIQFPRNNVYMMIYMPREILNYTPSILWRRVVAQNIEYISIWQPRLHAVAIDYVLQRRRDANRNRLLAAQCVARFRALEQYLAILYISIPQIKWRSNLLRTDYSAGVCSHEHTPPRSVCKHSRVAAGEVLQCGVALSESRCGSRRAGHILFYTFVPSYRYLV